MDFASDRRSKLRIVVGPDVPIHFRVKGLVYNNIRITNLSAGGCFATLPRTKNHLFAQGTLLEEFRFEHPDLEGFPFIAEVVYVLGEGSAGAGRGRGGLELIGLGIKFHAMAASMAEMLMQFVEARA